MEVDLEGSSPTVCQALYFSPAFDQTWAEVNSAMGLWKLETTRIRRNRGDFEKHRQRGSTDSLPGGGSHPTQQLTRCLQTQITQLPLPQVNPRRKADLEAKSTCFTEVSLPRSSFQGISQGSGSLPVELASADVPTQEAEEVSFSF